MTSGQILHENKNHVDGVVGLAAAPDGKWLASGSHDLSVCVSGRFSYRETKKYLCRVDRILDSVGFVGEITD